MDQLSPLTIKKMYKRVIQQGFLISEEDKAKILDLYVNQEWSQERVAIELNRTIGSIAGYLQRCRRKGLIGYRRTKSAVKPTKEQHQKAMRDGLVRKYITVQLARDPNKKERVRLKVIDSPTAVTLLELQPHSCRWPIGDPKRSDFRFCGACKIASSPYCEEHTKIGTGYQKGK